MILYPLTHFKSRRFGIDQNSNIIISLTSYPARINTVWMTVETLLHQKKVKPKKIILWLAEEQFPNKKIPKTLMRQEKRGLEIRFCDDLKPHKKYYYSFKDYKDSLIITVDDDTFYPEDFVEQLYNGSLEYPNAVICNWAHKITLNNNIIMNYDEWESCTNDLGFRTVPIGCCGILYKPWLFDEEVFNKDKIVECSLYTDDLWLKCMELRNNIPAVNINKANLVYFCNVRSSFSGLYKDNTGVDNRNDKNFKKLLEEYPTIQNKIKE